MKRERSPILKESRDRRRRRKRFGRNPEPVVRSCANRPLKEGEKEARATQAAPTKGTCPRMLHSPGHSSLTIYKDRPCCDMP